MVDSKASMSDYWYYTGLILAQFKGLQLGYAMAAPPHQVHLYTVHMHTIHAYYTCILYMYMYMYNVSMLAAPLPPPPPPTHTFLVTAFYVYMLNLEC